VWLAASQSITARWPSVVIENSWYAPHGNGFAALQVQVRCCSVGLNRAGNAQTTYIIAVKNRLLLVVPV
jgi:hypothetical protein